MVDLERDFDSLAKQLDFAVSLEQKTKLLAFLEMMVKWNKAYNLTSVRDPAEMLVKHIFDSIVVSPHLTKQTYADVGTGPGLPGLPLAIMNPQKRFVLIDSLGKRIRFIKQAVYELDIKNIVAIQSRVEHVTDQGLFDGVLSRAFASHKEMLKWCGHLVDVNGEFLALKGQLHQVELDEIPSDYTVMSIQKLVVPSLSAERHLVKIKLTE